VTREGGQLIWLQLLAARFLLLLQLLAALFLLMQQLHINPALPSSASQQLHVLSQ
jgi:hypothetical protein